MKYFCEIDEGFYTTMDCDGNYWTFRIKSNPKMDGKLVVSLLVGEPGHKWQSFAFLIESSYNDLPYLAIWTRVKNGEDRYDADWYREHVQPILTDPEKWSTLFAEQTSSCSRCGRQLRVPASLHHGRGAECAGKGRWKKADHVAAFAAKAEGAPESTVANEACAFHDQQDQV